MFSTLPLLLVLACRGTPSADEASAGPPPALVEVATARAGSVDETWTTHGDVVALDRAELAAAASGPVAAVHVREGDPIVAGQALLDIDRALASARVDKAAAAAARAREQLAQAQRKLERVERVRADVLARADLDEAKSEVTSLGATLTELEAAQQEARVELARHRILAPFDGVVMARHVDPGDWMSPGQRALDVLSDGALEVRVDADIALAAALSEGDPATIIPSAGPSAGRELPGAVVRARTALAADSRTALVRVSVPADAGLAPGQSASVRFPVRREQGGVIVPRDALVFGASDTRLFRVVDGNAQPVVVRVLARGTEEVVVDAATSEDQLNAGDVVVVRGNERLRPGQAVRLTEG